MSTQPITVRRPEADPAAPTLTVDLAAVAANTRVLADRAGGGLMAVVKADGFGLGAVAVASTALASGATWLGVTSLTEAHALREAGLDAPILSWLNPVDADWRAAASSGIDVAVPSVAHLEQIASVVLPGTPLHVHLHADTGMARDGAPENAWLTMCSRARAAERLGLVKVVGLMGHLARADEGPDVVGRDAFTRFLRVATGVGLRPVVTHLAATSATLHDPSARTGLCRVGAGLAGIDPSGRPEDPLRTAVTLSAPVIVVRDVEAGTPVGYGGSHVTSRPTRLVTLPLGYADGIPRVPSGTAAVQLHGRRCAVVGRVSMDQVVVDAGDLMVRPGDVATILGPGDGGEPTLTQWAAWAQTIPHDILTGIGSRVRRRYTTTTPHQPWPRAGRSAR